MIGRLSLLKHGHTPPTETPVTRRQLQQLQQLVTRAHTQQQQQNAVTTRSAVTPGQLTLTQHANIEVTQLTAVTLSAALSCGEIVFVWNICPASLPKPKTQLPRQPTFRCLPVFPSVPL